MSKPNVAGGLSRFAHLAGLSRKPAAAAKAEEETKPKDEEEEEGASAGEGDGDPDDNEDRDEEMAEDGEDDEDKDKPKDKEGRKAYAAGRRAERKRCAAIFGSPAAANKAPLAAELAFGTALSAKAAIAVLKTAPAAQPAPAAAPGLSARMNAVAPVRVSPDAAADKPGTPQGEAQALASRTLAAARAAGATF